MVKQLTCKERVNDHYKNRINDLKTLWDAYQSGEEDIEDLGTIYEYGLCFDYVPRGNYTNQKKGFFRYQLSTGGPGDEFRFFVDETLTPYRIEYWFLDWFDGAKKIVRGRDLTFMLELWDWFKECGTVEQEMNKTLGSE